MEFWDGLVMKYDIKLIVCMVDEVGDGWMCGCAQYWPLEIDEQFVFNSGHKKIQVTLLEKVSQFSTLVSYKLLVEKLSSNSEEILESREVTLLHFQGWPDLGVPRSDEEISGFQEILRQLVYVCTAK